jgi:hypothetical protein
MPPKLVAAGSLVKTLAGQTPITQENMTPVPDTPMGTIGSVGGDIATTVVPGYGILKGAGALQKAIAARNMAKGLGTAAAVGTDLAGNAGVSAALEPEDREKAGMLGAAGAAVGRLAGRVFGGPLRGSVSPQAKTLMEAGVPITPGQAVSGPEAGLMARMLRGAEDKLTSIPLLGDVLKRGKARATEGYNLTKINEALGPVGKIKVSGVEGLAKARELVSSHYDTHLPNIKVEPSLATTNIDTALNSAKKNVPFFDDVHQKKLDEYVDRFITPQINKYAAAGTEMPGQVAKKLDSDLGDMARKHMTGGLGHEPLGEALYTIQAALRTSMRGTTPPARQSLREADAAYAKMLPILEAGRRTGSGNFTPRQLAEQLHRAGERADPVTEAAKQILPDSIPDTGTAGRGILAHMLTPSGAGAGAAGGLVLAGFGPAAAAAATAAALYTRPGLKAAVLGVHPTVKALRNKFGAGRIAGSQGPMMPSPYPVESIEDIMRSLAGRPAAEALE